MPLLLPALPQAAPTPRLTTPWTAGVSRTLPHPEYPRPMMVRKGWTNLNGPWEFQILPRAGSTPSFVGKILVPFAPESYLSGIMQPVAEGATMVYRRSFPRPKGERVILHFGAVDWRAEVEVNGQKIGEHEGGYDAFSFDITSALRTSGPQEIVVRVQDPIDADVQPRGKQVRNAAGIYSTSGIWQTVWLEGIAKDAIRSLKIVPSNDGTVRTEIVRWNDSNAPVSLEIFDGAKRLARIGITEASGTVRPTIKIPNPKLWSPDSPKLYRVRATVGNNDAVESYFAFREVGLTKDAKGRTRLALNGKPLFMAGPLDQGFWPDGLYTAPTDAALRYDLEVTKRLGFNTIRKHVKVEPQTWYAHCDRMGILVWQDMPSGDRIISADAPDLERTPRSREIFRREYKAMVENLGNHPSIIGWVLFNEGWGQFDAVNMTAWAKSLDTTRLLNATSGWTDRGSGDMVDWHNYPGPASPKPETNRAAVLGEFGGLGAPSPGHIWKGIGYGYQWHETKPDLTRGFVGLFDDLRLLMDETGLSAAIYTQTTDVGDEQNGFLTFDRRVLKLDEKAARHAVGGLWNPAPTAVPVLLTSESAGRTYRFTLRAPADDWASSDYDDSAWPTALGPFGVGEEIAKPRTAWTTPDLWLRREFSLDAPVAGELALRIAHDEDAEVWLDGQRIAKLTGFTIRYRMVPIALSKLSAGRHVLAIKVRQTAGGQFIDLGLVRIDRP